MKNGFAITALVASTLVSSIPAFPQTEVNSTTQVRFFCGRGYDPDIKKDIPTTFAQVPQERKTAIIRWRSDWFKQTTDTAWNTSARCEEVSPRFQQAYEKGMLEYLTYGKMNRQSVICATRNYGGSCQQLILTIRPEDNPIQVLNRLNGTLNGSASTVLNQSSGESQVYIRFDVQSFINQSKQ